MKCTRRACAVALALICSAVLAAPVMAQGVPTWSANSRIKISYDDPKNEAFRPIQQRLKDLQVLERLQLFLAPLRLTSDIEVKTAECPPPPAGRRYHYTPYQPGEPVIICYEYVKLIEDFAPAVKPGTTNWSVFGRWLVSREMALVGPFVQEVLHNVALAALETLEIPVWGRVEDAADHVAALLMLNFGTDVALKTMIGNAYFLNTVNRAIVSKKDRKGNPINSYTQDYLGDIRPPLLQRYYNMLCMAVGKDTVLFSTFVVLEADREPTVLEFDWKKARSCRWDYEQVAAGFRATFVDQKHVDPALLEKVRAMDWLKDP